METEIEVKFLDVDPNQLRQLLKKLGAKLIHNERLMRRHGKYPVFQTISP